MKIQPEEKTLEEQDCQNKLLEIPGVMLSDVEVRTYELSPVALYWYKQLIIKMLSYSEKSFINLL